VTLVALEGREVVVIETVDDAGGPRRTRTWIADDGGAAVDRGRDARAAVRGRPPPAAVARARAPGRSARVHGRDRAEPDGHERIRRLLADRYGWADCWIAMVADTHASLGIRLDCA
jgi:hypothetical protein